MKCWKKRGSGAVLILMTNIKTYLDSTILIASYRTNPRDSVNRTMMLLDDPTRRYIVSDYVVLETLPKPSFYGREREIDFMKRFFVRSYRYVESSPKIVTEAISLASKYDLQPLDALHLSAAIYGKADEFLTLERPTSPLCRVKEISVISLYRQAGGA
jgi:predicted nucleic acid-binding protein